MNKDRQEYITSYIEESNGQTYTVHVIRKNGNIVVNRTNVNAGPHYQLENPAKLGAEGIIRKTDNGLITCLEKLTSKPADSERIRYTRQFLSHTNIFIKDYVEKNFGQLSEEELLPYIRIKLDNVVNAFSKKHPSVDLKETINELANSDIIAKNNALKQSLQEKYQALQEQENLNPDLEEPEQE